MANERKQHIKPGLVAATGLLLLLGAAFSVDLWHQHQVESPHYANLVCAVCHDKNADPTCTSADCTDCHAVDGDSRFYTKLKAPELTLCTSCHGREGDVVVKGVKVTLGYSHPWGIVPSPFAMPRELRLRDGRIVCQTCHDVHAPNDANHMVRLAVGRDFTPLCHDCHAAY